MLKKITLTRRIALGIIIPLSGLLVVGSIGTYDAYRSYSQSSILGYVTEAVNELAALTDTLQVERGQTAIMLGAGSKTPQLELIAARKAVDLEIVKVHTVNEHVHDTGDVELINGLDSIEEELKTIANMRGQIDSGSIAAPDAMKFYSKTISHILELGFVAAKKANDPTLVLENIAVLELGSAKEYAGQERGLVAGILSSPEAPGENVILKLEQSIGKQDSLLNSFVHAQPLATYGRFKAMVADIDSNKVDSIRHEIADAAFGKRELSTEPKTWFAAATQRIEAMRAIEIEAMKVVEKTTKHVIGDYLQHAIVVGGISFTAFLLALLAGFFIARSIASQMRLTIEEMQTLADGDTNIEIGGLGVNTEIGKMADAIQVFKENEIARVALEEEANEERTRAEASRIKDDESKAQQQQEVATVVTSLGNALQRLANGDLSKGISTEYAAEFAQLKNDFGDSIARLSSAMNEIRETTVEIGDNANELRISADDLAKRTEQQAAALEQTSAALEEITGTVKESADRANEAREKAGIAKDSTAKSSLVVKDAVDAMERIETASGEIENIISVIDEIAFQTNLLALNAGVEAARAGEAGKGFAVVAQEVRELAGRSAAAAKQIKELISNSGAEVSNGVSLVKATGEALTEISQQVIEIDTHIQSIARASSEQSEGLTEVNKAVNEMDQVTQRNAAMVEETNAVTHRLSEDATTLTGLVSQFQTNKTARGAASAPAPKQAAPKPAAKVAAATQEHNAVKSPAHAMVKKVAAGMGGAAAAPEGNWDEF